MPRYTVDDGSGNTLILEGDSPPTEQELEELFGSAKPVESRNLGQMMQQWPQEMASIPAGMIPPPDLTPPEPSREQRVMEETWGELSAADKLASDVSRLGRAVVTGVGETVKGFGLSAQLRDPGIIDEGWLSPRERKFREEQLARRAAETSEARRARLATDPGVLLGERISKWGEQKFPNVQPESVSRPLGAVAEGIGSTASFLPTAALGPGAVMLTGAFQAGASGYQEAIDSGATDDAAETAFVVNALGGTTEALPIARIFNRINKASGSSVSRALKNMIASGFEEAAQETFQQTLNNAAAKHLYDEERELLDGVAKSASTGGAVGFLLSGFGIGLGATGRRLSRQSTSTQKPNALQQETTRPVRNVQQPEVTQESEGQVPVAESVTKAAEARVEPSDPRIAEMETLQRAREEGMLTDPFDQTRLTRLEKKYGVEGLSAEDARYIILEREGLKGVKIGDKSIGIEVVETNPTGTDAPFSSPHATSPFTINPQTGNVVVIADRMQAYRSDLRRYGLTEAQINQTIKSSINEEVIHLGTEPQMALEYWNRLSGVEKLINERRYGLGSKLKGMSPELLGMEALRFRIQQASKMTPTEFAQMVTSERWTWQAITALEKVIRAAREKFTQLGREQRQLFDITLANLDAAKEVVSSISPAAPVAMTPERLSAIERRGGMESLVWPENDLARYRELIAEQNKLKDDNKILESTGNFTSEWQSNMKEFEELRNRYNGMPPRQVVEERAATSRTPAAPARRGPMSRRGEDAAKLAAMRVAQAEGTMEAATEAGTLRQEAFEPVTPERAMAEAERYVLESKDPSFKNFTETFRAKFGNIPSGQLRELFAENIGEALVRAPGARVAEMLKSMGLVKQVIGGGKPGERRLGTIPDALGLPPREPVLRQAVLGFTGEQSGLELSKALQRAVRRKGAPTARGTTPQQRLRFRALGAILHRLFKETEGIGRSIDRKTVSPDEVGSPLTAKEPVYGDIRASELTDVDRLGKMLTSDARSFNRPVSASKRLVILLNKQSGAVDKVDIYMDPRRGAVVMSPTGASAHQSLESVMRTHRPIHSILLDEPVQNFRKRYKSLKEYNDEFGTDARYRAQEAQYEEFVGEPVAEPELEAGAVESSGTLARPEFRPGRGVLETEAPITDAEAMAALEYVRSEVKNLTSPEDVALAVDSFKDLIKRPIKDRPLRAISGIIKMVRSQMEQNDQLTEGQALEQVSRFIYETQNRTTPDQFVRITLANYSGRIAEAGEQAAPATSPTARELTARDPGRIEGVGGGLASTMARGTQVRQAAAEAAVPARAEAIRQEAQGETYESAFDRVIKETSRVAREAEAEVAREVPRLEAETTEQWLVRVREWAATLEEFKAAQDQAKLAENITPAAATRTGLPITQRLADLTIKPITAGIRVGSEWMVDRLKRVAPQNAGFTRRELNKVSQIISDQQRYSGDMFNRFGDNILRESGRMSAGTKWMNDLQVVIPGKGAIVNSVEAIEGRLQPPEHARALTAQAQEANVLIGEFMEPVSPGFVANGGMSRNLNAFGYDIIRNGSGPDFRNLVEANAKANGISVRDAQKVFVKMKRVLDDPNADPAALFTVNQDFVRIMPRAITHIWTGGKRFGHWEPVIHSELFNYFNHGIRRAAMIRAFRETYPVERVRRTPAPTPGQVQSAVESNIPEAALETMSAQQMAQSVRAPDFRTAVRTMRSELPGQWHPLINSLYRTLQGHPSENIAQTGWLNIPGSVTQPGSLLVRTLSPLGQTMKSMWLSQQIFLQPGELMSGASEIFFGYRKSALATLRHREMYPMLESAGAVDKIMYDNAWNVNSPIRSAFRVFNNTVRRLTGQNLWNELQESQAAGAAYINAERILEAATNPNFKLTWTERNLLPQTFRVMGFSAPQVSRMMKGDAELLGQMIRKAASFASGGHMHPAEQSRLSANRAFQGMFWFQRYPMTRLNQFQKLWEVMANEAKAGRTKEARNTALLMAKFMAGATQQGLLQTAILTAVYGGPFALALKLREAEDEPFAFFFDMWRSAMGGPLQLATRGWEDSGLHGVANNFKRLAAPVNIAGEVYDVANGTGAYSDMDLTTRIGKYLQRSVPLSKTVKFGLAATGLSEDDYKLDESVKALNKWKRQKFGFEDSSKFWKEDERRDFRIQMKKAVEAIKDGDTDKYLESLIAAAGVVPEGKDPLEAVQQSFNARRVLRNPQTGEDFNLEETEELIQRIGDEAYERIQAFDMMLKYSSGQGD